jgi:hypothetical protein
MEMEMEIEVEGESNTNNNSSNKRRERAADKEIVQFCESIRKIFSELSGKSSESPLLAHHAALLLHWFDSLLQRKGVRNEGSLSDVVMQPHLLNSATTTRTWGSYTLSNFIVPKNSILLPSHFAPAEKRYV